MFEFGEGGCSFVHQELDATYAAGNGAGDVTLHIDACVSLPSSGFDTNFPMTGTFTITTALGTLTGAAAGTQTVLMDPVPITLTLTPVSGTGAFTTLSTGTLQVNGLWFSNGTPGAIEAFRGAVTVS